MLSYEKLFTILENMKEEDLIKKLERDMIKTTIYCAEFGCFHKKFNPCAYEGTFKVKRDLQETIIKGYFTSYNTLVSTDFEKLEKEMLSFVSSASKGQTRYGIIKTFENQIISKQDLEEMNIYYHYDDMPFIKADDEVNSFFLSEKFSFEETTLLLVWLTFWFLVIIDEGDKL